MIHMSISMGPPELLGFFPEKRKDTASLQKLHISRTRKPLRRPSYENRHPVDPETVTHRNLNARYDADGVVRGDGLLTYIY